VNPTGGPALASGGTGDVLRGIVTGHLAQGLEALEGGALAAFGVRLVRARDDWPVARELILFAVLPVLVAFVASVTFARSAFVPRYLIGAAPAYLLLIGLAVARMNRRHVRLVTASFALFTLAAGALTKWRGGEKIPWDEITAYIARRSTTLSPAAESVAVVTFEGFTAFPLTYYTHEHGHGGLRWRAARALSALDSIAEAWVVYREGSFATADAPQRWLQSRGIEPTNEFRERTLSQEIVGFHFRRATVTATTAAPGAREAARAPSRAPSGKTPPDGGR